MLVAAPAVSLAFVLGFLVLFIVVTLVLGALLPLVLAACEIVEVLQPSEADQGEVIEVIAERNRILVEGVNYVTKHTRVGQSQRGGKTGGKETMEAPIHISNVALVDPKTKKPTRVGFKVGAGGGAAGPSAAQERRLGTGRIEGVVSAPGIEPGTYWLKASCSTN